MIIFPKADEKPRKYNHDKDDLSYLGEEKLFKQEEEQKKVKLKKYYN